MAFSAFDDKTAEPTHDRLDEVLLAASELWSDLVSKVKSEFDPIDEQWVYSGKKWGWALRLKRKKRAVLYLTPAPGFFHVGFALGEKAVAAAHRSGLSESTLALIDGAQKYAEGRAVRFEVRSGEDVSVALQIARIKMAN